MFEELDRQAREILLANDKGGFTIPTSGLYPYQWNWDSLFVALGFATFDESRAVKEIETLFDAQAPDGFMPHIVFRRNDPDYFPGPDVWQAGGEMPTSGITQPPVAGSVLADLWSRTEDEAIRQRIDRLFPKVLAWHRWFNEYRVPEQTGAVIITHPWESGRDNSPEWDRPASVIDVSNVQPYQRRDLQHADAHMRPTKQDYDRYIALVEYGRQTGWDHRRIGTEGPFRVADVGMTMILLRATRDLMMLGSKLGHPILELQGFLERLEEGANYLWDDELQAFCSRDTITGQYSGYLTSASFLYAYADVGSEAQRQAMARHFERISAATTYMLPSHDPQCEKFDPSRYWRGPLWLVVNYLAAKGFAEAGMADWAQRVVEDSRAVVRQSGFWEAFNPESGDGTGGEAFSWTAAMWLAWLRQSAPSSEG
ncbi:MAG: hypothetical protein AAF358_12270 [Pseudomonadota bacterium]